ncbi:MAG: glycosyltransferase [Rhodobacteraceae bacterium]|nr:glycosyltransferase [Paracoccaceae bacterium]
MHRSGTSFLASCAPAFGYRLPRDMAGPQDDNPKGHFEPAAVVAFNDSWLGERGHGWDRIVPPAEDETSPPAAIARTGGATEEAAVAALRQSFGRAGRICIKDPRLAFTLPVWRRVVAAAGMAPRCLITVRDPAEVARSLGRRDGLPSGLCAVMWTIQTIAAFRASAGLPRAVLIYPDWAADPGAALSAAFPRCGIAARPDRAATAVRSLFAPAAGPEPADPLPGEAGAVARALFEAVRDAARDGGAPPEDVLADAGRAVEAAGAAAIAAARTASGRILDAQGLAHRLAQEGQAASARAAGAEATARRLARQLAATERQRDAEAQRLRGVARDYRALEGTLRRTEAQRDRVLGLLAAGEARAAVAEAARASAEAARKAERDAAQAERDAALAERDAAAAARDAALAGQDAAVGALAVCRQEATALTGEIASLRGEIDAVRAERDSLRRLLEETEMRYRAERLTVLRPAYRKVYRAAGRGLRLCLPAPAVERLKRIVPNPDAIPAALAHVPLPPPQPAHPGAAAVRPADPSGPPDIFVFAIIDWDFRVQRPQHLAREFARRGHRVFYVEMQSGTGGTDLRGIDEGLFVLRLGAGPAGFPAPYTGRPTPEQTRDFLDRFDAFCDRAGTTPERLVVVQHPFWWPFLRHLGGDNRLVLDCMDEIAGFANTEPHVLEAEAELAAGCDRIVVSSAWLEGKHAGRAGDVRLVRNAVDPAAFRLRRGGAVPVPAWLPAAQEGPSGPALKAGYVGAIAEWFDVDLLAATARLCPDIAFHLCGAVTAPDALRLGDLPNVTLHGEIPYADVPGFIAAMDVMTIPFRLLPIIRACDPVKFYEHCAAGRPTVATALPELDRAGDLVFRAGAPADFAAGLRAAAAAGRDPAFVARLEAYAAANTWAARAADFLDHVLDVPLVSAVILSHGRPDLTLAALESLAGERPAYPRLDIIVVDNASDPADLAALRRGLSRFPAVRLVEAPRNLGFAAGNNLGIAAARGDFVLLLNSDTFVPEGAIAAMLRHLQRNPRIGVVGPLTNRIGNEAQVPVAYGDIAGMRQAARRLVRGYRGTWTEVEVCAYFCVMFRAADLARFGPLPEIYGTGMFEDDDHCRTIRAMGFSCALAEDAFVHHHLSASFEALGAEARARLFARNRQIFEGRWGPWTPHRHRDVRPPDRIGVAA